MNQLRPVCRRCEHEHDGKRKTCENCLSKKRAYRALDSVKAKTKAYNLKYVERNAESIRLKKKKHREANKASIKTYAKSYTVGWRKRNAEKIKQQKKEDYNKNKAKIIARSAAWVAQNKDRAKATKAACYAKRRDKYRALSAAWYDANKDRMRLWGFDYRANNRERLRVRSARYYQMHQESIKTYVRAWRKANKHAVNAAAQHRRAVLHKVENTLTKEDVQDAIEMSCGLCAYCLKPYATPTVDHVEALTKLGANAAHNIVIACGSCNSKKGNRGILCMVNVAFAKAG